MLYAGLDVSSARVAICALDEKGAVLLQRSVGSGPGEVAAALAPLGEIERIGLEAGPTSAWLARGLRALDRRIAARAKASGPCRRLTTGPGVGPLVALTYVAGMDDPQRFAKSRDVGAHFGLTPRRRRSGETGRSGGISRAGDAPSIKRPTR